MPAEKAPENGERLERPTAPGSQSAAPAFVSILMGSASDLPSMQAAADVLDSLGIACELCISSAHRTPEAVEQYVADAEHRGCRAFIAGAGMAAHLAGSIAARTLRPVIGVPVDSGALAGLDALLSTVQMPPGVPVACMAIGQAGAKNAGYFAAQVLAVSDPELAARLCQERRRQAEKIRQKDADVGRRLKHRTPPPAAMG